MGRGIITTREKSPRSSGAGGASDGNGDAHNDPREKLYPESISEGSIKEAMELLEMAFGSVKTGTEESAAGQEKEDDSQRVDPVATLHAALDYISKKTSLFLTKRRMGELGACEVLMDTLRNACESFNFESDAQDNNNNNNNNIDSMTKTLVLGCQCISSLADTEATNKVKFGNCGAIAFSMYCIDTYFMHKRIEVPLAALQILINLPNRVSPEHSMVDNISKMNEEGVNEKVCKLLASLVGSLEGREIGHDAAKLTRRIAVDTQAEHDFLEKCCDVICTLANRIPNSKVLLEHDVKDLLLSVVTLCNPVEVPLLSSLAPLEEISHQHNDDEDVDAAEEARVERERQEGWNEEHARLEEVIAVATIVNNQRFLCVRPALYALILLAAADQARVLISNGEGRHGSIVKLLLNTLEKAFFDPTSMHYCKAKKREIDHARSANVAHWDDMTDTDKAIHKKLQASKINPVRGSGPVSPMKRKGEYKNGLATGGNGSPMKLTQRNMLAASKATASLLAEKVSMPISMIVCDHACWALNLLTTASSAHLDGPNVDIRHNHLELAESGGHVLYRLGTHVSGDDEKEKERQEEEANNAASTPKKAEFRKTLVEKKSPPKDLSPSKASKSMSFTFAPFKATPLVFQKEGSGSTPQKAPSTPSSDLFSLTENKRMSPSNALEGLSLLDGEKEGDEKEEEPLPTILDDPALVSKIMFYSEVQFYERLSKLIGTAMGAMSEMSVPGGCALVSVKL